jgi:uncharacterized protein
MSTRFFVKQDFNQSSVTAPSPAEIFRAALRGDGDEMRRLIAAGADLEARNAACHTPLMIAAARGNLAVAKALLEAGADVNATANGNSTALSLTAALPDSAMTELLLTAGADPLDGRMDNRKNLLRAAVSRGDEELFHTLVRAGTDALSADDEKRNLLMLASESGQPRMAKILIDAGIDPLAKDSLNRTAAHRAAAAGDAACLKLLLDAGAPLEDDRGSDNLLYLASKKGSEKTVDLLLSRGAKPNLRQDSDNAPLRAAIKAGSAACVELLLKAGADPMNEAYEKGKKITDEACAQQAGGEIEKLVCAAARKFHLPRAAKAGEVALVKTLLDEGIPVDLVDRYGKTALLNAAENAQVESARLLIAHKANINFVAATGDPAMLFGALRKVDWDSPAPNPDLVDLLLASGADPNCRHPDSRRTALAVAVEDEAVEMAARLLKHKADPNLGWGDDNGKPLALAVSLNTPEMVKLLMEHKADPNQGWGEDDRTPLFQAVAMKSPEIVKLLIDNGASVLRQDKKGGTAYEVSKTCPNEYVRELVKEAYDREIETMAASATQSTGTVTIRKALKIKSGGPAS